MDQVFSYRLHRYVARADATVEDFKLSIVRDTMDDWLGVYEVWWTANHWYPEWPLSERLALAERAVRELLAQGLVELWEDERGEQTRVPPDEFDGLLRASQTWTIPEGPHVWLSWTAAGKARVTRA